MHDKYLIEDLIGNAGRRNFLIAFLVYLIEKSVDNCRTKPLLGVTLRFEDTQIVRRFIMLTIDFHTHTYYSKDSLLAPRTLLRIAKKKGLDGIAVTDHDTIKGIKALNRLKRKKNAPIIIPGIEVSAQEGEIILLFEVDLPSMKKIPPVTQVLEIARDIDAVILLPHPFDRFRKGINPATVWKQFDVLETFNSRVLLQKFNIQAQKLATKHRIPQSAGSDAHTPYELGRARTTLYTNGTDIEEIRTCLIRGKSKIDGRRGNPIYPILGWAWKNTRPPLNKRK